MGFFKKMINNLDNNLNGNKNDYVGPNTELAIKHVKMLGIDMVNKANSGHPGIILGAAPIMYSLFRNHLIANPKKEDFFNRDRFVLSAGHGSALLYSVMHVAGYQDASLDELMKFRQIHSKTPGHPENYLMRGVDATTGPLGQGIAMGVGMALAESFLSGKYNIDGINLINHYTYVLHGDGCIQEGVAQEAISLAGRFKLNKLIMLYDSNDVQLDGFVADSTRINVRGYFESQGWNYIKVERGNSVEDISNAIVFAKTNKEKPTLIEIKTIIGHEATKQGTFEVHGAPLGENEANLLRQKFGLTTKPFEVDSVIYSDLNTLHQRAEKAVVEFDKDLELLKNRNLAIYEEFTRVLMNENKIDAIIFDELKSITKDATRNVAGKVFDILSKHFPTLIGGSADLSGSTKIKGANGNYDTNKKIGRNINYGVREFAMASINNGIALHGACIPIGATFLSFLDYNKAAIRMAAIQKIRNINVFTHDSIFLGEDGPTHQPIEQIWTARLIPNHTVFRPCNVEETIAAFKYAIETKHAPTTIIASRLAFDFTKSSVENALKGGYIIRQSPNPATLTIISTGAEVALAIQVAKDLEVANPTMGINVVSMPSVELFEKQPQEYKNVVLQTKNVLSLEPGVTLPWAKYANYNYGINRFGESASPDQLRTEFKFNKIDIINYIITQKIT